MFQDVTFEEVHAKYKSKHMQQAAERGSPLQQQEQPGELASEQMAELAGEMIDSD